MNKNKFRVWDKVNKKFVPPSYIAVNGDGVSLITDSGMLEKLQNRKADIINTKANINLAIKELGLKPKINAEVGVRKMCDWFKNSSINFK